MKALTLKQPWATAIALWGKGVENRTWKPPEGIIGQRIAIHAGKAWDAAGARRIVRSAKAGGVRIPDVAWDKMYGVGVFCREIVKTRGIVCTAVVSGWVDEYGHFRLPADHRWMLSPWFQGPIGWVLSDIAPCDPIPCRGAQGLWTVPEEIAARLNEEDRA